VGPDRFRRGGAAGAGPAGAGRAADVGGRAGRRRGARLGDLVVVVVAVERGTPLGDVLRAQAADVREQHKRDLIEAGGRREVLMLVPSSIGLDDSRQDEGNDRKDIT
jgi:tight adherence protein C